VGVAALLANWTNFDPSVDFATASTEELEHLLTVVPRTSDGAISHRESEVQLWADFVYMAPPFIAYYGALQNNKSLLLEAYNQCRLYRQYLRDPDTGLWMHIVLGSFQFTDIWATGNAWAAGGMLRVLETISRSSEASSMKSEQADLVGWIDEIITNAWKFQAANGTLFNDINQTTTSFPDSSGTAMLGASTYRLATITGDTTHIPNADKAFSLIKSNVDADGWLTDVVDPESFTAPGEHSPEGQSFTIIIDSARRDFMKKFS